MLDVCKNHIHESLKGRRSVSEAERHHQPFIQAIVHVKSSFPLVAIGNAHEMICMLKIDFGVDFDTAQGVQEVGNEG